MHKSTFTLLSAGLLALPVSAVQKCWVNRRNETIIQPGYTGAGELLGCVDVPKGPEKRDDGNSPDTYVEVGDDTDSVQLAFHWTTDDERPWQFENLWWRHQHEECGQTQCNGNTEICVPWIANAAIGGDNICMTMDGQFDPDLKDHFFELGYEAFERAVETEWAEGDRMLEHGPDYLNVNKQRGDKQGWIQMRMYKQAQWKGCHNIVGLITSVGSFAGKFAPVFGLIDVACAYGNA